jgi:hypothetical protein
MTKYIMWWCRPWPLLNPTVNFWCNLAVPKVYWMNEMGMFCAPVLFVPTLIDVVSCQICFQDLGNVISVTKIFENYYWHTKYSRESYLDKIITRFMFLKLYLSQTCGIMLNSTRHNLRLFLDWRKSWRIIQRALRFYSHSQRHVVEIPKNLCFCRDQQKCQYNHPKGF